MSPSSNRKPKTYTNAGRARNRKLTIVALIAAIIVVAAVAYVVMTQPNAPNNTNPSASPTVTPSPSPTPPPYYDSTAAPLTSPVGEYSANGTRILFIVQGTDQSGNTFAGNITIQMRNDKPITTTNFVNLVKQGFYSGTLFHRVVNSPTPFMIQGGQNASALQVPTISDEIGNDNHNTLGTIAMAKTSAPNSATSEFFINIADNSQIQYQDGTRFDSTYTVFGQVIGGMDIVSKIAAVQVQANAAMGGEVSQPVHPVTVLTAVVLS